MTLPASVQLSDAQRATLEALATCILDGAPLAESLFGTVLEKVEAQLRTLALHKQRDLANGLTLVGGRLLPFLTIGKFTPFASLSPASRALCFARWGVSRIPQLRTAHQAFRRLVFSVHYAEPQVQTSIGYGGAWHAREDLVSWEGALSSGTTVDDEPVARGVADRRAIIAETPAPSGVIVGKAVTRDEVRRADVVVIGSGAGGAVAAAHLAEAGHDVVILEEGEFYTAADFTEREAEMTARLFAEGGARATEDLAVLMMQGTSVGGSTTVNWMVMLRTPEHVLNEWARDHGAYGLSPSEMAPVFAQVEHDVHSRVVPHDAHSPNNLALLKGAESLGWHAQASAINARGCVRSGFCGQGCRYDAKQGTLLTYVPRAIKAGATLYADAHVERVSIAERDTGSGAPPLKRVTARITNRDNGASPHTLTVEAPIIVVAGGAVGTPVLLQRSGLGGGGVGNWLRLHPTTAVIGCYPHDVVGSSGIPLSATCDEFLRWNDTDYGFWIQCPPLHPALASVAAPGFGAEHAELMKKFRQLGTFIALTRDGADTAHSSGSVKVDAKGITRIQYRLSQADGRRTRAAMEAAARMHFAAGATEVRTLHTRRTAFNSPSEMSRLASASLEPNDITLFSAHVNGTCRMGTNPETSGANPDGQRHGVRGLYIADGSLLPTALGVNPQETIMALSTVIARRIAARHRAVS